jgi:hypothetical protein
MNGKRRVVEPARRVSADDLIHRVYAAFDRTMNPYSPFPPMPLDLALWRALMPCPSDRRHEAQPPTFEQARNPR